VLKSRFLFNNIRETAVCNPGNFFLIYKALPLFDLRGHPEDLSFYGGQKISK